MAGILHGGSCHIFHHNHSHGGDLLNHQRMRSSGDDEVKVLQIDDIMTTQSECKSENINVQAAFLHVLGDFLQSIGVIVAAIIIKIYVRLSKIGNLCIFSTFLDILAARSESCGPINHVFVLNHCDVHDRKNLQKVSKNFTRGGSEPCLA